MSEASGSRADAHGSNTLTDNNTVTSGTGIIGDGAVFTAANSEYLSVADTADLRINGDFSISLWFKPASLPATNARMFLASKTASGQAGWQLSMFAGNPAFPDPYLITFAGFNAAGSSASSSGAFTSQTVGAWCHIVGVYRTVPTAAFACYVNGGLDAYGNEFADTFGIDPTGGNGTLRIGASGTPDQYFDGVIDEVAIWSLALTPTEVKDLYNGGAGLAYPLNNASPVFRRARGVR